jgi:hypothetical protein
VCGIVALLRMKKKPIITLLNNYYVGDFTFEGSDYSRKADPASLPMRARGETEKF